MLANNLKAERNKQIKNHYTSIDYSLIAIEIKSEYAEGRTGKEIENYVISLLSKKNIKQKINKQIKHP